MLEELKPIIEETLQLIAMSADDLRRVRDEVIPTYLHALMENHDWSRFSVIGFTSTFQQNTASFALARRIKAAHPQVLIVFGGANFDGPMGPAWMRAAPFIDLAVRGEADRAFPALLTALAEGRDPLSAPGVLVRRGNEVLAGPPATPLDDLDQLPIPDFEEYFERAENLGLLDPHDVRRVDVPFESSRGCWWGEKATCRFCGLNGSTMTYRAKSPERVLHELETLAKRHRSLSFNAADNILSRDYLRSVMTSLASSSADYWLFYEVKSNLSRQDIKLLAQAGVRSLQPGIESLSSHVLRLMLKGAKASTNVNLLRWTRYYGIETHWNVLFGFPGETFEDYDEQQQLARRIAHLQPPGGFLRIGLERFSPYFESPEQFPVRGGPAVPEPGYAQTYPDTVDLAQAAYHFAGELDGSLTDADYQPLIATLRSWHGRWAAEEQPSLTFWWTPGLLHIEDRRSALAPQSYQFEDPHAAVYLAASDAPIRPAEMAKQLNLEQKEVTQIVEDFCRRGLMMGDGAVVLSLALPGTVGR
jgi:ribosomal peptide maturation radical SAM protein 1